MSAEDGAKLRVSLREPAPRPTVLQIDFLGVVPASDDAAAVKLAKRALSVVDDACGVPYVAPAECGALPTPICRAFRAR